MDIPEIDPSGCCDVPDPFQAENSREGTSFLRGPRVNDRFDVGDHQVMRGDELGGATSGMRMACTACYAGADKAARESVEAR
ncbi:hypothetical protein BC834DRAFT_884694 [Gloeopeniophorella convolvens]|nr:hypothetical protein BC834DRAFT_884694 [Gloeopeniophorella convolvens]